MMVANAYNVGAQQLLPPVPQTNGQVNVTHRQNGVQYVGGNFTQVGYPTGAATLLPGLADVPNLSFPKVMGTVYCSASDGNGGWYLGGSFSQVGGLPRQNLVHITGANAVDGSFSPSANSTVQALLLSGSSLYVGGSFTTLNGLSRNNLGALDAGTGALLSFDPNVDGSVNTLALNGGNLLAGGSFQRVGGSLCPNLAAFSTSTGARVNHTQADGPVNTLATDGTTSYAAGLFNGFGYNTGYSAQLSTTSDVPSVSWPVINGAVSVTVPDGNGGWYVGGSFSQVGGVGRDNLVHITAANGVDASFAPSPNGSVTSLLLNGSTLYAGGNFTVIGGQLRNSLAGLSASTGAASSFNPNLNNAPSALALLGTTLYVGGSFTSAQSAPASYLVSYDLGTGQRTPYPGTNGPVQSLLVDGSTLFVGGSFSSMGFYTGYSAQLSTTSDVPAGTWPAINGTVNVTISDGSGGWYVGGSFNQVGGINRSNLVHITAANAVDASFNPAPNSAISALLKAGSMLYVGGSFSTISGQVRTNLAALNAATGAASGPDLSTDGTVQSLAMVGTTLYAGGNMVQTQGRSTRRLVAFDTSTGTVVPGLGTNSTVRTLLADGPTLYVGGNHTQAGISVNNCFLLGTASDTPAPNWPAINGTVSATVSDGSGGWYVGGSFSSVGTLPRRNLVRILADNTVDPGFAPDPNSTVQALALQGSTLYVGGSFDQVGGQARLYLAAVDAGTGAALAAFDATANSTVTTLAATATALYVGGNFSSIGGQPRNQLAALNPTTGAAASWNPAPNSSVNVLLVDAAAGTLYVSGSFSTIAGQSRSYLSSFATATGILNAFAPNPNSAVLALAVAGNTLYVGGSFSTIGGQSRSYLAGLDKATGTATSFNPRPNSTVSGLTTDGTTLFAAGSFTTVANGATTRNYLAAFALSTGSMTAWDPNGNSGAGTTGLATDGSGVVVFNSSITLVKTVTNRSYLTALTTSTGQVNTGFNPSPNSPVQALALAGSTLYVGGGFTSIGGQSRPYLAGVDKATGTASSFNPQPGSAVTTLATDGTTLFVGGNFTTVVNGATMRNYLAAFTLSTGGVTTWNPNANASVQALGLSGTALVAGGSFTYLKSVSQNGLVALDAATGTANTAFVANFNAYSSGYVPQTMAVVGSTLYLGGFLYQFNGASVSNLLGLNKATGDLSSFAPTINGTVTSLVTDGNALFVGGHFTQAGGGVRNRLAAFTLSTGALTSWNPNANSPVQTLGLSGTGIVAGGSFTYLNYQTRSRLASLTNTGQVNLAFSPPSLSGVTANTLLVTGSKLYLGGSFNSYTNSNGVSSANASVTAFDKVMGFDDGSFTLNFSAGGNRTVNALSTDGTTLWVGGSFTQVGSAAPGTSRNRLAAFTLSSGLLISWDPSVNNTVYTLARNGSDLLAGGNFTLTNLLDRQGLFAYSVRTGRVLPGFNAGFYSGQVSALATAGTKLYVGGSMYTYNSGNGTYPRGGLVAVNNLTGADLGFSPNLYGSNNSYASSAPVAALAVSGSTLYVGGGFNASYSSPRNYLAAYDVATDALVSGFNPAPNGFVYALAVDGPTLYAGGDFTSIGGQTRNRLAAFSTSGNTLAGWAPNASSTVRTVGVNSTAVYAGGYFTTISGQSRSYAAALDKATAAATTWNPALNNVVYQLIATDTRIALAGDFTTVSGQAANRAAVLSPAANTPVFAPQLSSSARALTLSNDTLLVGGNFTTANGEPRNYLAGFTLPATPTIISFTPASGPAGTFVTVTGSGFTGATGVTLNGTAVSAYTITSATQFTFTVPAGAATGRIALTTTTGTGSSTNPFTVLPAVAITSFSPASGSVGSGVTIAGNGFVAGNTIVRFNGVIALNPSVSPNSISVAVPSGASTGPITVTAPGGTATSATDFTIVPAPTITSFTPASGMAGDLVTLTGTDFGGATSVAFNGYTTSFTVNSATSISATVPNGATTGPISVTTLGGTGTSSTNFTAAPGIYYFTPTSGPVGTVVSIYGYNLATATQVQFNGAVASFTIVSGQISATVPAGATTGLIRVTTPDGSITSVSAYTVTPSVTVSSASGPNNNSFIAAVGNTVTVFGTGFSGATQVTFNGMAGTSLTVTSNTQLTVVVPTGATTGPLTVTTPAGSGTLSGNFTILPAPTITSFSPSFGTVGSSVTVYGTNIGSGTTVTFGGGSVANASSYGTNSIAVTVPTGASTGPLTVTTLGGTATSATPFTVVGAPTITSFSPSSGLPGASISITGTNLSGLSNVYFNSSAATFSNATSTSFTAVVPAGTTSGPIRVYTPTGTYLTTTSFTVLGQAPTITSFSPISGPVGTSVTVTGSHFTGTTGVTVGGVAATSFSVLSATSLSFAIPAGAVTGPIAVTNPSGSATSSTSFTVVPIPTITSFSPTGGAVGITVAITGSNFQNASGLTFNGTTAPGYVVDNTGTSITVNVPTGATTGLIQVTTPGGTASSGSSFTVSTPAPGPSISGFTPTSGVAGTTVTINGTNLTGATSASFNGMSASVSNMTSTSVTAQVPAGATTGPIMVNTSNGSATSVSNFVVNSVPVPTISSIAPTSGPTGTSVVIMGTSLNGATAVTINGVAAASFIINSASQVTAIVPAAASTGPLAVTTAGGTASSAGTFTVMPTTLTAFSAVCANAAAFPLTGGAPGGGQYSGPGVSSNQFAPAAAGAGTHTITYSFTLNGVTTTATQPLTVNTLPGVTLTTPAAVCYQAPAFALTGGSPAGGTYSGVGVSGSQFNPTTAGVGTHTITYSYMGSNSCAAAATSTITVLPQPTFTSSATRLCMGQSATLAVNNAGTGATYLWNPGGATTASITISPATTTNYSVAVTNAAGCSYPFSQLVTIDPAAALGAVSLSVPAVNASSLDPSMGVTLSWLPTAQATSYDVYVWLASASQPTTPVFSNLPGINLNLGLSNLTYGQTYNWQVIAHNSCFSSISAIRSFSTVSLPDLRVTSLTVPATAIINQTVTVSWRVSNTGAGSTGNQQWADFVYLSTDHDVRAAEDILLGQFPNQRALLPNQSYTQTLNLAIPATTRAGAYHLYVLTNRTDAYCPGVFVNSSDSCSLTKPSHGGITVHETTIDNNWRHQLLTLQYPTALPDLVVTSVGAPSIAFTGAPLNLTYRVKNRGAIAAQGDRAQISTRNCGGHYWYDSYYLSADSVLSPGTDRLLSQMLVAPRAVRNGTTGCNDPLAYVYPDVLEADSSLTIRPVVQIPHNVLSGTYYVLAVADVQNNVLEGYNDNNNVRASSPIAVTMVPPPDLVVTRVTAPATASAGQTLAVSWQVENDGARTPDVSENIWYDKVLLSRLPVFNPDSALSLGEFAHSNANFGPGASYSQNYNFALPRGLSGQFYVYVWTDARNQVFEYNSDANNITRSTGRVAITYTSYPDLVVTRISLPDTIVFGQPYVINWTLKNQGAAPAIGPFDDQIVASPDTLLNNSVPVQSALTYSGTLQPGQSIARQTTHTFSYLPAYANRRAYFFVRTDATDAVYEYGHENNNQAGAHRMGRGGVFMKVAVPSPGGGTGSGPGTVPSSGPLPVHDLRVLTLSAPANAGSGSRIAVTARVRNFGPDSISNGRWRDVVYLSADSVLDAADRYLLFADRLATRVAGNTYSQTLTVTLPDGISGRYYLLYSAGEMASGLYDSTPNNNTLARPLNVSLAPSADLVVAAITSPDSLYAGQTLRLPYQLLNQGTGSTVLGQPTWHTGVYLSPTPLLADGMQLGTQPLTRSLAAGAALTDTITLTVPRTYLGNYYLIVVADNSDKIYEYNAEGNNTRNQVVHVRTAPQSDLVVTAVSGPATARLGVPTTLTYTIRNAGAHPTVGTVTNNLYVSSERPYASTRDRFFGQQSLLNQVLAPGAQLTKTVTATPLAFKPGYYRSIAQANALQNVSESNYANNRLVSSDSTRWDVATLQLGVQINNIPLTATDQLFYQFIVPANLDVLLTLTSNLTTGANEVYVAYDRIPTSSDFDFRYPTPEALNQHVVIPATQAGSYYIYVRNASQTPTQLVSLLAQSLPYSIRSIAPATVGQGVVTTTLQGAGFRNGVQVRLLNGSTLVSTAQVVSFTNTMELKLKWTLTSVAPGTYTVETENPDGSRQQLANGLRVVRATPLAVDLLPNIPNVLRAGRSGVFIYSFRNSSNVDIPVLHGQLSLFSGVQISNVRGLAGNPMLGSDWDVHPRPGQPIHDWYTPGDGLVYVPFIARDVPPGGEVTVQFTVGLQNFKGDQVTVNPMAYIYQVPQLVRNMAAKLETIRRSILATPLAVQAFDAPGVLSWMGNRKGFTDTLLTRVFEVGLLHPADTVGFNFACDSCLRLKPLVTTSHYSFSPGASPGTRDTTNIVFASNGTYRWEINKYNGQAGQNPGWDLLRMSGTLNVQATAAQPFKVSLASLTYQSQPGLLAGWRPAVNKSWPIAIARGGITGFAANKFRLVSDDFTNYNNTYGGIFSLRQVGDTIKVVFTAMLPGIGMPGIPGAPGAPGENGSDGGIGGPSGPNTLPGKGGQGGPGGPAIPSQFPITVRAGNGGNGGPGGNPSPGFPSQAGDGGNGGAPGAGAYNPDGTTTRTGSPGGGGSPGTSSPGYPQANPGQSGESPNSSPASTPTPTTPGCQPPPVRNKDCEDAYDAMNNGRQLLQNLLKDGKALPDGDYPLNTISQGISYGLKKAAKKSDDCGVNAALNALADASDFGFNFFVPNASAEQRISAVKDGLISSGQFGLRMGNCIAGVLDDKKFSPDDMGSVGDIIDGLDCVKGSSILETISSGLSCGGKKGCTPVAKPCDPNEIIGPNGYGPTKLLAATANLPYKVLFENDKEQASASAQRINIRVPIDANLNPLSVQLGDVHFHNRTLPLPTGLASYHTVFPLTDSLGVDVELTAGVDVVSRELFWEFQAIDHATGLPPADPVKGFLPPNDSTQAGEGFVTYTVRPRRGVVTGDSIWAQASIVFDFNDAIATNRTLNLIDALAPVSVVNPIATAVDSVYQIRVNAQDEVKGSGVRTFDLYSSQNGQPYQLYLAGLTNSPISFTARPNRRYCFYALATDNVGNAEEPKTACEAVIPSRITSPLAVELTSFSAVRRGSFAFLAWTTASEKNNAGFFVEVSTDGQAYHSIGWVPGHGTTTRTINYSLDDAELVRYGVPVVYYRLRQRDTDGTENFSPVRTVAVPADLLTKAGLDVWPNPTTGHVSVTGVSAGQAVQVYDVMGRLIITTTMPASNILQLQLPSNAAKGLYLIRSGQYTRHLAVE